MAVSFLNSINLNKNELLNARIQNVASAPSSPVTGQIYYDTGTNKLFWWNGSSWIDATGGAVSFGTPGSSAVGDSVAAGAASTAARSDHVHGREAFGAATSETTFGTSAANGSATTVSHSDHGHGNPVHTGAAHSAVSLSSLSAPTADLGIGGFKLTGVATPTVDTDAATKAYSDANRAGLDMKQSVRVATTANITLSGEQTIDGVLTSASRVLVKNQSTGANNGIYLSAAGAWARATDADVSAEVTAGMATWVEEGTTQADTRWVLTTDDPITLGSTALVFSQDGGLASVTAGAGLTKTGNVLDVIGTSNRITVAADSVDISTSYVGQASITTLGTVTTGVWTGTDVAVADGGTGASTAAGAKTNLGFVGRFAVDVGDNSSTSITVTHNLGTKDVQVTVYDLTAPYAEVLCDTQHTTTNTCTLVFAVAPTSAQYRAVVVG